ncbi:MAG: MarR family winged helix-turn-helix transcriptional regulator [Lachnospirales bacterium]
MGMTIYYLNRLIMEVFDEILFIEETSLKRGKLKAFSISEIHTLDAIGIFTKKTMTETSKKLNITVGTLTSAINNLVKKDLVTRYKDPEDKRVVRISLSKKGRVLYRAHEQFHKNIILDVISTLNDDEKQILVKVLEKVKNKLENN